MAVLRFVLFFAFAVALAYCGCGDNGKLNRCTGVVVEDEFPIDDTTEFDAQVFQTIVSLDHNTLSVLTPKGCYTFELTYCDCSTDAGVTADDMCSKISLRSPKFCQITKEGFKKRTSYKALYDAAVKCDNTYKKTNKGVYNCLTNCCKTWRSQMRKELGLPSSMFGACKGAVKALTIGGAMKTMEKNNPEAFGHEDDDAEDDRYYEYEKRAGGDPDGRDEFDPDEPQSCPLPKNNAPPSKNGPAKNNAPPPKNGPAKKNAPPAKNGPAKNGPAKNGPAKNGPAKNGPAKNGPAKNGPAKNGPAKNGPAKNGPAKKNAPPPKNGSAKNGSAKNGPAKNGPAKKNAPPPKKNAPSPKKSPPKKNAPSPKKSPPKKSPPKKSPPKNSHKKSPPKKAPPKKG